MNADYQIFASWKEISKRLHNFNEVFINDDFKEFDDSIFKKYGIEIKNKNGSYLDLQDILYQLNFIWKKLSIKQKEELGKVVFGSSWKFEASMFNLD